jgi:hypothetical protein
MGKVKQMNTVKESGSKRLEARSKTMGREESTLGSGVRRYAQKNPGCL